MNILMLAWRDMDNPLKGGAEIVTDIYLKGLAERKHKVVLFTAKYKDSLSKELFNDYEIIRKGNKLTVYFHGLIYAWKNREKFDKIIDQVNTIPFFTPLLISKEKRVGFFHQLCLNVWFWEMKFPVSVIGYILEKLYLLLYHNTKLFVVSKSTANDLIKYAWCKEKNIKILENQIDFKPIHSKKIKEKAFCFCGRLKKSKRVHDCIKALSLLDTGNLYIIGNGDTNYKKYLTKLIKKFNLEKRVIFTGQISFEKRNEIMQKCLAILVTSVREGWGLIVTEANANGTIGITYDIPGLRDANKKGIICKKNNHHELAKEMKNIINNEKYYNIKLKKSIEFAKNHCDWDNNIDVLERWLEE